MARDGKRRFPWKQANNNDNSIIEQTVHQHMKQYTDHNEDGAHTTSQARIRNSSSADGMICWYYHCKQQTGHLSSRRVHPGRTRSVRSSHESRNDQTSYRRQIDPCHNLWLHPVYLMQEERERTYCTPSCWWERNECPPHFSACRLYNARISSYAPSYRQKCRSRSRQLMYSIAYCSAWRGLFCNPETILFFPSHPQEHDAEKRADSMYGVSCAQTRYHRWLGECSRK